MKINQAKRGKGNRFGARKYGEVISSTNGGTVYQVAKVRVKGTRNYTYRCTCPHFFYRQETCKHILAFKKGEQNDRRRTG